MLIDLATAKLHLRVDGTDDDAIITLYISAAEGTIAAYAQRNIYADAPTLAAAVAAAPASLAVATVVYDAAILAAELMDEGADQDMATFAANYAYAQAQKTAQMTFQGIVVNDQIKTAILLTVGHLFENREDSTVGQAATALPMGCSYIMQPYRAY